MALLVSEGLSETSKGPTYNFPEDTRVLPLYSTLACQPGPSLHAEVGLERPSDLLLRDNTPDIEALTEI